MAFVQFKTEINSRKVTVDIEDTTYFIADAVMQGDDDWQPNGLERQIIINDFKLHQSWLKAHRKAQQDNFLRHNDIDAFGNCFSDADNGL